jgi:hypothetical protein
MGKMSYCATAPSFLILIKSNRKVPFLFSEAMTVNNFEKRR